MLRTLRSILVVWSMALVAVPAFADVQDTTDVAQAARGGPAETYSWDMSGKVQPATVQLPDERTGGLQTVKQVTSVVLMLVLTALGLTITFTSLRNDMKQRRPIVYRPRGPRSPEESRRPADTSV